MVALTTLASVPRPRAQPLVLQGQHASGVLCVGPGRNSITVRALDREDRVLQAGETTVDADPRAQGVELVLRADGGEEPFHVRIGPPPRLVRAVASGAEGAQGGPPQGR
jgi:hypothetical protein